MTLEARIAKLEAAVPAPRRPAPPTPPDDPFMTACAEAGLVRWDDAGGGWVTLVPIDEASVRRYENIYFDVRRQQGDDPWADWQPPRKD